MEISIIVICLLLSAFFSGMEIAYVSSNKIHIEIEKKQEGFLAAVLTKLTKRPSKYIATMLVGNNLALVIYGFYMGDLVTAMLPAQLQNILVQTVISTLIILITAEFLPKVFFQIYANKLLKFFAVPAYLFYVLFGVITEFIIWISDIILKYIFKTEGDNVQLAFSKIELGDYISEQMESVDEGENVDSEIQIFQNALEFSEVKARDVMIPRTEITAVEIDDSIKMVTNLFTDSGYSKILVYEESIDDIVGYVHSFDMFKRPKDIKSVLMPVGFVPETMLISEILNVLIKKRKSIAVVIDEYGGTSGILTVEDIVEELFGEIEDEHDVTEFIEEQLAENEFKFSARLEVDYINENYKIDIPESENYGTLGGFIMNHTGEIPQQNEVITIENFRFKILDVAETRIKLVHLHILEED
ncbi:Hemolysin, contains CBS domains [Pustulibacterium marinum]|uniref:Hemolysin, contains CBS domains n=1 Tax=Pustulibacterium marinum TaxID=1224947 RepID=A0A1I7EUV8_9FLAO|nr:hemolysin family protein [Pustulibacterium marinum]SFU27725.1 Hemolysin, contains CBS domains [Pustulibacterium marinum]